ncbi:MAG: hypothetical protein V1667_02395 [bacterium]
MQNIAKEQTLSEVNVKAMTQFMALAGIAMVLPFFLHLQFITGPIVNAILILVLFLVGIRSALVMALIPSLMALAGGLLPVILAPAVPFIMVGNVIFVLIIDYFYSRQASFAGYWKGVLAGAALKFIFLYLSVGWIIKLLLKQDLAAAVAKMMSWPQFATAFTGGMIAWVVLKWLKRV